ncbi:MAG: pseudaminic acid synthase [Chloroflexi bacterium]|nr:pseudaminic acid synthase [Chloroflexota bacterium]
MTPRPIFVHGHTIGGDAAPFVIAEMSANHNGSLERALAIVDAAADAGAHAVKIQTYTADTMTLDIDAGEFAITDPGSLWRGRTLYDLYREAATPYEWHREIFDRCRSRGLVGFSSPFDPTAVDFLESLGVGMYKIASAEVVDIPLIRRVASTGKPMVMSTGMTDLAELSEAIDAARGQGCQDILVLKCTSAYPAPVEASNVLTIPEIRRRFDVHVGFSDHTLGLGAAVAAVALGAVAIEKHFTLSREDGGVDAAFSATPDELARLVRETATARRALGGVQLAPSADEIASRRYRRSLYIVEDMKAGDVFTAANVRAIRPGLGLAPKHIDAFIGRAISRDAPRGTALTWEHLADARPRLAPRSSG